MIGSERMRGRGLGSINLRVEIFGKEDWMTLRNSSGITLYCLEMCDSRMRLRTKDLDFVAHIIFATRLLVQSWTT